jgi:hypothetical protein
MNGIKRCIAAQDAGVAASSAAAPAEDQLVNLLRQIALAGGSLTPQPDPNTGHGYTYALPGDDGERDLNILTQQDYLEARFFDRVSLCPKCNSHRLNVREICPGCRRAHLASEGLIHHFRCGYVGIPSEFSPADDGSYVCPKCNRKMHHLGTEFDRLGKAFVCRSCGLISENPPLEALCFACSSRTLVENLVSVEVFRYVLTSRGAAAVRHGSLPSSDDGGVSIADAPVYRRTVILEFLNHEMRCLQEFNIRFSVLLAECDPATLDRSDDISLAQWLTRLRHCLRDVDLLGQLGDALYLVVLPQTRRRAAESFRERIAKDLGPNSPFTLSTVEIADRRDLAQLIAGRNTLVR